MTKDDKNQRDEASEIDFDARDIAASEICRFSAQAHRAMAAMEAAIQCAEFEAYGGVMEALGEARVEAETLIKMFDRVLKEEE